MKTIIPDSEYRKLAITFIESSKMKHFKVRLSELFFEVLNKYNK